MWNLYSEMQLFELFSEMKAFVCISQNVSDENCWWLTFRAITRPEGLWHTLLTTPPFPAPSSQICWKSSSFSSPRLAFCVRKASRRFFCCSSKSSSSSFFCRASRFALRLKKIKKETSSDMHTIISFQVGLHTYSDAASMDVEVVCASPAAVITMGSGLFFGAMADVWIVWGDL